ncbi:hypothetical protein HHK36_011725 [Tetracentron sinense]|uniref:Uncharacterized protein n=1 Tax=Tetracentron sinense TaxID=13715 RepID=A0A835DHJ9_TETSI|nr:hypothetical protein HHK36_011725 [Tetracentron sinense]
MIDDLDSLSTTKKKWRLCSMNQVEEVKLLLRLIPIWLTSLMYGTVFSQINTFFTKQGSTMNTKITSHFHVPPASLQVSICLVVIVAVPIYDRVIIPIARKITGYPSGITMLQRIGIGIILSVFAMVAAALVEARRVTIAREHALMDQPHSTVPMTIWWLLPQYVIVGVSEVFGVIGLQELFYDQMPYEMRSMGAAAYLSVFGIGSFISTGIISVIQWISERGGDKWLGNNLNRAHLDYYYWVLAGLITLSLCGYLAVAKSFVYKKISSNAML